LLLVEVDAFLVLFEIAVDILEDKVEFVFGGDYFSEVDYVGVG
jgi:hypothetical protein